MLLAAVGRASQGGGDMADLTGGVGDCCGGGGWRGQLGFIQASCLHFHQQCHLNAYNILARYSAASCLLAPPRPRSGDGYAGPTMARRRGFMGTRGRERRCGRRAKRAAVVWARSSGGGGGTAARRVETIENWEVGGGRRERCPASATPICFCQVLRT